MQPRWRISVLGPSFSLLEGICSCVANFGVLLTSPKIVKELCKPGRNVNSFKTHAPVPGETLSSSKWPYPYILVLKMDMWKEDTAALKLLWVSPQRTYLTFCLPAPPVCRAVRAGLWHGKYLKTIMWWNIVLDTYKMDRRSGVFTFLLFQVFFLPTANGKIKGIGLN